ncbi:hypothetical protein IAR55_002175 [Kwoniella newhampshirensis]|uniref:Metal iron transporter n=1 Tax=Kwoniella newhampshirensis TaxID=1651941 RepID=A0AAW0Z0N8_9TREE
MDMEMGTTVARTGRDVENGNNGSKEREGKGRKVPNWRRWKSLFLRHLHFVGPGLVSSVAYIDPGNWATDLEAGSNYGYKLLFVVLLAGLAAVVLQLLSVRLGAVTSTSLPTQTRLLFVRLQAKYPKYRVPLKICLWFLYILAEVAIIGTDLAELLGSAIALHLLFPKLPIFAGVLITAADVMIVLVFFRSNSGRQGMLLFEIVIVALVLAVFISFMILLKLTSPVWKDVFFGFVPSATLVKPGALYVGVGIIGATVMPHALFLGSSLASVDRLDTLPIPPAPERKRRSVAMPSLNLNPFRRRTLHRRQASTQENDEEVLANPLSSVVSTSSRARVLMEAPETPSKDIPMELDAGMTKEERAFAMEQRKYEDEVRRFDRIAWVNVHLLHSTIDTTLSLLGFALTINSSILTLAGAAFFYNDSGADTSNADLFGAYDLIKSYIGRGAAIIFALALLCAGQSASITATLAGQIVSEGFINWKTSPLVRRLVTRLIGVIPAAVVASAVGPSGLNTMLVASQVLLSIVLPTVIFPLVYLCSQEDIMTVQGPEIETESEGIELSSLESTTVAERAVISREESEIEPIETVNPRRSQSYASAKWVTALGYALFSVVVLANGYVIVELGLGND